LKNQDSKILVFAAYVVLLILGLYHHEMWRDEYEEYLQARDAEGFLGIGNIMNQGHAMLWQSCLWVITRFTHDPLAMKFFHGIIAASFAFVLIFKSPFKLWQSGLLLFGYFFLFEYAVISRCYAFGVLFFMLFAWNYSKNKKLTWSTGVLLFLLANTSIYAMMLASVLVGWLFFMEIVLSKDQLKTNLKSKLPIIFFAGIGILLAYLQIRPQPDNSFPLNRVIWPFDQYRSDAAITQFFSAFVPICKFNTPHFWNTNFLMDKMSLVGWYWSLLVFIIVSLPFLGRKSILVLWLCGVGLILFFQYHTGFRYARYYGHFFLWWLLCFWLIKEDIYHFRFYKILGLTVFILVITSQAIGGIMMYYADWTQKFSRGPEVARYLKSKGYANSYMIGTVDFSLSPISAELDRKIYTMQHKKLCSNTKWDGARLNSTDSMDLVEALNTAPKNEPLIFIATHPVPHFDYFKAFDEKKPAKREFDFANYHFNCLAYFKRGIEYYEGYWIFKVEEIKKQ
jgi:hypothetical protein